jgi:hypothetical protein
MNYLKNAAIIFSVNADPRLPADMSAHTALVLARCGEKPTG